MSQLPLADVTPLRVTGTLFKDLVFAFQPQDIPNGARTLRTLRGNDAIIVDEVDDASIVLVDPEHPCAPDLLREATNKVVLHYSWVNKSLISGRPLVESSNWGDCRVTPENITSHFSYVPPPTPSNTQLQTPRPTPEDRSHNFSTPSRFPQNSAGIVPPLSQPPYTPTPSHWNCDPVMLQQQTPQLPPTNQVVSYNPQPTQSPSVFSPFPTSQPADMAQMVYGQQPAWPPFHPGMFGMVQPPTVDDVRRACEVLMWFQRPPMYQQLPPPPTPTQPNPTPHSPTPHPPSAVGTQLESSTPPEFPAIATLPCRDDSHDALPDLGDPPAGPPPDSRTRSASPQVPSVETPSHPPFDNAVEPPTTPKLFQHADGESIKFCVPVTTKMRGKMAQIFRLTGGEFKDDVEDADYLVLDRWEANYFDEMWYCAQDNRKPAVTSGFVIDSYEKGRLLDPSDYQTREPVKLRRDAPKAVSQPSTDGRKRKGRGRGSAKAASPRPMTSEDSPRWLRFFKEAERKKSFQYIGAMLKRNSELTCDALAMHLHDKMSNHTINSWKRFCLHHVGTVDDLRKRAISNAERRAAPEDMDTAGTRTSEGTRTGVIEDVRTEATEVTGAGAGEATGAMAGEKAGPGTGEEALPAPQQPNPHENQPPPLRQRNVTEPGQVLVKTEPLDEDQLDFAFATDVLSRWNANEECDAALWKRMESMRPSSSAPSWEMFCEKHRSRFEHFFAGKSTQT